MIDPFSRRLMMGAGVIPASQGRGPVVLMYHSVTPGDATPDSRWAVSERRFFEQLVLLKSEGWNTLCVRELDRREMLPPKSVVITFDDGFADNFEHAFQHLLKLDFRATWFVVTGDVGGMSRWQDKTAPQRLMLTPSQLIEMDSAGMEIGAHTRTHPRLTELAGPAIDIEVFGSRQELEDILHNPVTSFAYPYGRLNNDVIESVRRAGFRLACTTRTGWFGSELDPLQVRRVAVFSDDNLSTFARKIAFADTDVSWSKMRRYFISRIRSRLSRSKATNR